MISMQTGSEIDEIISNIVSHRQLSPSQARRLRAWTRADEANVTLLENILRAQREAGGADDARRLYLAVMRRVETAEKRSRMRRGLLGAVAAASCVAVAFLVWPRPQSNDTGLPDAVVLSDNTGRTMSIGASGTESTMSDGLRIDPAGRSVDFSHGSPDATTTAPRMFSISVPFAKEFNIVLPDGTKVWMNSGSTIGFPEFFDGSLREVRLTGEAWFDVTRDERKPFVVMTGDLTTRVYGTEFLVSAYEGDSRQSVSLVEGSVGVTTEGVDVTLSSGEGVEYNGGDGTVTRFDVDPAQIASLRDGLFVFDDMTLGAIADRLARWYGVPIGFDDPELAGLRFFIRIDKYEEITDVLEHLAATGTVDYRRKADGSVRFEKLVR